MLNIAYEWLTGHPQYEGSALKSRPPPPQSSLLPALVIILKCDAGKLTRSSSEFLHEAFLSPEVPKTKIFRKKKCIYVLLHYVYYFYCRLFL
jgi:hypothetical protein